MKKILSLITPILFFGCAHSVHLYQADNSTSYQGKLIESYGEQRAILGFVSETNYVNEAFDQLKAKCPQGRIEGINTRYSTSLGFFNWTNKVRIRGYCMTVAKTAQASPKL